MKKVVSIILTLTLILSAGMTTVFADPWKDESGHKFPPGLAKKGNSLPPGLAKKIFDDIDDIEWAKKAIENMKLKGLIKGTGNGRFAPYQAVTKLETVIMALRVMGWEYEAKDIGKLPKEYKGKRVSDWAKGYVTVAYEKGILDDVDMMYFEPEGPALRHEVAKYVIRALGYDEEAKDSMDEELPFVDASIVPQGSVGYVYLINDMELMQGDSEGKFNPLGTLTRAEMAVLFQRLDRKVDNDVDENEIIGEVHRIYEDRIVLNVDGETESFAVTEDVIVYEGRNRSEYSDIQVGDTVLLEFEDNVVVYIEITDGEHDKDKIITEYEGKVVSLEKRSPRSIAIMVEKMMVVFEVIDRVEVRFENGKGSFDEIKINDMVTVVVDNKNRARKIYVERERENHDSDEVEGVITELDLSGEYHISIGNTRYVLSKNAEVTIEGDEAELDDLIVGMKIEAGLENNVVVEIDAESVEQEITAKIKDIEDDEITIEELEDDADDVTYRVADDVEIEIDGDDADMDDLAVGDVGEFEIVNDVIVKIEIEDRYEEIEGVIAGISDNKIGVLVDDEIEEYGYANMLVIKIEGHSSSFSNLQEGMEAELKIRNGLVYEIKAKDREFDVEGKIDSVVRTSSGTQITLVVDDEEYLYDVSEDVEMEIEDVRNPDVSDLEVGMEGEFEIVNNTIVKIEIED